MSASVHAPPRCPCLQGDKLEAGGPVETRVRQDAAHATRRPARPQRRPGGRHRGSGRPWPTGARRGEPGVSRTNDGSDSRTPRHPLHAGRSRGPSLPRPPLPSASGGRRAWWRYHSGGTGCSATARAATLQRGGWPPAASTAAHHVECGCACQHWLGNGRQPRLIRRAPGTSGGPRSIQQARGTVPARLSRSSLLTVAIWEALATESRGRPVDTRPVRSGSPPAPTRRPYDRLRSPPECSCRGAITGLSGFVDHPVPGLGRVEARRRCATNLRAARASRPLRVILSSRAQASMAAARSWGREMTVFMHRVQPTIRRAATIRARHRTRTGAGPLPSTRKQDWLHGRWLRLLGGTGSAPRPCLATPRRGRRRLGVNQLGAAGVLVPLRAAAALPPGGHRADRGFARRQRTRGRIDTRSADVLASTGSAPRASALASNLPGPRLPRDACSTRLFSRHAPVPRARCMPRDCVSIPSSV
jgi:hypothetical protein